MKYLKLFAFMFLCNTVHADERVAPQLDVLVELLNDSYSSEFVKARNFKSFELSNANEYVISVFTIEGLNDGNNWTQYLSVFQSSYKVNDLGESGSEVKFRLVGFVELSAKHKPKVNFSEAQFSNNTFIFPVISQSGSDSNIEVVVKSTSLEVQ